MSSPLNSRPESPGLYVIREREGKKDLDQLYSHDQMITAGMGGVLPEQPALTEFQSALDVGCGTGSWLIETARTYSTLSKSVGIDKSERMIGYAHDQAAAQQVDDQLQFRTMEALSVLDFSPNSFDLVNQRLGGTYLRTWDWPSLLSELQRVTRRGGVIRITEADVVESNSPTLNYFNDLLMQALYQSGHFFTLEHNGVVPGVMSVMQQLGLQNIQTNDHTLHYRAGTPEGHSYYESMQYVFQAFQPFFRKWINSSDDFDTLKRRAQDEMQEPDFVASWKLTTIWGNNRK